MTADDGAMTVRRQGKSKFVARVGEVTFNGKQALRAGKTVFYVTPVGLFRLTRRGVVLTGVMPGIDVRRDILDRTPMRIALPASGPEVLSPSIVSGAGFALP
jgi:propionate CoA-transferase